MPIKGKLFLIVGPSGVGKGTVIRYLKLHHPEFFYPVSCTTRAPRPHEVEGEVYNFISREEFNRQIDAGDFLEWAKVHEDEYYGTLKQPLMKALKEGKIAVREVDIQGFESIQDKVPKENLVSIFLYAPSWEILEKRILRRGKMDEKKLTQRRESFIREMPKATECNYKVESKEGKIKECVSEVEEIIGEEGG